MEQLKGNLEIRWHVICSTTIKHSREEAGKLPPSFGAREILLDRFVKEAAASVNRRFGSGCE